MTQVVISTFKGLRIKKEDATQGVVLPAKVASDVDLRNGVIKPFKSNSLEANGHNGEIIKIDQDWYSGKSNYAVFNIRGFNILVFKDGTKWKRIARIPSVTQGITAKVVDLGLTVPPEPTIEQLYQSVQTKSPQSPDLLPYSSAYAISWKRRVDGFEDESGLSPFKFYESSFIGWRIRRPLTLPDGVYGWNIYRLDTGYKAGSSFRLVAEKTVDQNTHDDYELYDQLRDVPDGLIDDNGITVLRTPPVVEFDGIAKYAHHTHYVAWKDNNIYFSEPANIDSFPVQYRVQVESKIENIEVYGQDLYIFTDRGVLRGLGLDPFTMRISPNYIGDRIGSRRASVICEMGLFYATATGMNRVSDGQIDYISRVPLGEAYFKDIDPASIHMNYGNGIVYMFHNRGTLLYIPENGIGFIHLTKVYQGSFYDRRLGVMNCTTEGTVQSLFTGNEDIELVYETGDLTMSEPSDKYFDKTEFFGEGKINVTLFLDGVESNTFDMDLDGMDRQRELFYPRGYTGRSGSYRIRGRGTVKEVKYWLYGR